MRDLNFVIRKVSRKVSHMTMAKYKTRAKQQGGRAAAPVCHQRPGPDCVPVDYCAGLPVPADGTPASKVIGSSK
jgi:hypothetical protein